MFIAALFIRNDVENSFRGEVYAVGDTQAIFFGIFFGILGLATATPNIKGLTDGRMACKEALSVIDRKPDISAT